MKKSKQIELVEKLTEVIDSLRHIQSDIVVLKDIEIDLCCYDFELAVNDYKTIVFEDNVVRFKGVVISYCPFCSKKIM